MRDSIEFRKNENGSKKKNEDFRYSWTNNCTIYEGKISFSGKSYLGANYWINEERKKAIEIIEKENNILVYYAIEQKYMGDITMLYLFYISPYEEDWELDHQSIVENYQYTYGLNETDPFLSEFGEIKFKNMFGGLVKQ